MTTYLNTSLETYKQFAELSKKMAEDFLKEYNLLHGDKSVRVEKDEHNGDELIINPENEAGVTAYVEIEERINVEELYKNVVRSIAENVFGTLSRFDFEKEFQEDWNETFEEESGLTADEYEKKLYTSQEDFENKSFIIERDAEVLANSYGFPKTEENKIWGLTRAYLKFFVLQSLNLDNGVYFTNDVALTLTGYQVEAVSSDKKIIKYSVNIDACEIAKKATEEKISDVDILNFVINEVRSQIKAALDKFDAKEECTTLANENHKLIHKWMKYYIKAEKQFKNYSKMMR